MSREVKLLRVMGWVALVAGLAGAVLLWVTAREVVEETRRIVGHATLTFQDLEVRISVARIALGTGSLVLGLFLWALGRVVAGLAEARSNEPPGQPAASRSGRASRRR